MVVFASNENTIRRFGTKVLSLYYWMYAKNINGVIYPKKRQTAEKLGINRSTLTRYIQMLVHHGLAIRKSGGFVSLLSPKEVIRQTEGHLPFHKCTLMIDGNDTVKEIDTKLRKKILEEHYRQVQYMSRETKITHLTTEKFGEIISPQIFAGCRKKVKSQHKLELDDMVPMTGKSIAECMGISKRSWHRLQNEWKATGQIRTSLQREILHVDGIPTIMDARSYEEWKFHQKHASFRRRNGEVVICKPNLVHLVRTSNTR